ncbi:MAG: hypothetical protein QME52_10230 [Bacteroidota bacterium]|nr:hypothetical protein [Bacteroidota bacterium]
MRYIISLVIFLVLIIWTVPVLQAQDLEETLGKLAEDAARGYVQPIVSGFGADMNSGWFYRAPEAKKLGIDLDFGLVAMGAFMGDVRTFSASSSFQFDRIIFDQMTAGLPTFGGFRDSIRNQLYSRQLGVTISGPTIVGAKNDSIMVRFSGGDVTFKIFDPVKQSLEDTSINLLPADQAIPVGGILEDIPMLPFAAPQLSIGTVYGTKIAFRYLPDIEIDSTIGSFSYFGFGIQHNPFMWIPLPEPPLDVSLGFFTQTLKVGKIFQSSATLFGAQASKTFGPGTLNITPYAGLSIESSSMTFTYDYISINPLTGEESKRENKFELEGDNSVRFTLGFSLKLAVIKINADYNIAKYNSISAGFGFIF